MALPEKQFHVIEFDDGVQIIPNNWIQRDKNKECFYPNFKTDKDINKAIKKCQTPQDDWSSYRFKRVFGSYDFYSEARAKLKKSETTSDINTDIDDKAQRKNKAKKQTPSKETNIFYNNNEDNDDSDSSNNYRPNLPPYPKAPTVFSNPEYTKNIQRGNKKKTEEYVVTDTEHINEKEDDILNYLQRIQRMLADIKFDVSYLTEQNQLLLSKLNLNVSNQKREYRSPTPNDELSKLSFPLQTVEEMEFLQRILASNEEGLKERMFNILATIGGSSYEEMSKRMLLHVFTNEVASLYSWVGGKGKRKLYNLEVMKLMFKVLRKTFPNVTEKEFETKCKDWFRHAKHRFDNEKRRQNATTTNINDDICSQQARDGRNDEREASSSKPTEVGACSEVVE